MKKLTLLTIFTFAILFSITACGKEKTNSNEDTNVFTQNNWIEFCETYQNTLYDISDTISNSINEGDALNLNTIAYNKGIYNLSAGDSALMYTSLFFDSDTTYLESLYEMFEYEILNYEQNQDQASITVKSSSGDEYIYELMYDEASISAVVYTYYNGTLTEIVSICETDEYYAKTFWSEYGEVVEAVYYKSGDLYMGWDEYATQEGDILYKNPEYPKSESFIYSLPNTLTYIDGVVDSSTDFSY